MTPKLAALGLDEVSLIRFLNDKLRINGAGGRVLITRGIHALSERDCRVIVSMVRMFNTFTEDNDPHGEHDFGAFYTPGGLKIFWKIDYYDPSMESGSENPANHEITVRVLTIILAEEY